MKFLIEDQWFCETSDVLEFVKKNTLKSKLQRSRESKIWQSIPNPHFKGSNSRKLILIDSIPNNEIRKQILKRLEISQDHQNRAMSLAASQGINALTKTAIESTSQLLRGNAQHLAKHLHEKLEKEHVTLMGYFMSHDISIDRVQVYARKAVFAGFVAEQIKDIHLLNNGDNTRIKQEARSFRMNLIMVLENHITDLGIPTSDQRFKKWCDQMFSKLMNDENPANWIEITRSKNNNRSRFTAAQKKIAEDYWLKNANPYKRVYEMLINTAQEKGWWMEGGEFKPITYATLCNHLNDQCEKLELRRVGLMSFKVNNLPSATRNYPNQTNMIWGMDATAHNEWVTDPRDPQGTIRQKLQVLRVFDYSSLRLLATVPYIGGEKGEYYSQAYRKAVIACGYKPKWIQTDQGPASDTFETWCKERGLALVPAGIGLSRAKLVENLLGRLDNLILRHALDAWSGMNLTATGPNSHPQGNDAKARRRNARNIIKAAQWTSKEAMEEWNSLEIDTLNHKPCKKTPIELWNGMESATDPLAPELAAVWFGQHHEVQLTIKGLDVEHTDPLGVKKKYTYFPSDLTTDEAVNRAIELFQRFPHSKHRRTKLHLYITEYGKEAHVFQNAWTSTQSPKYLGRWVMKPVISMAANLIPGESEPYQLWMNFRDQYMEAAKAYLDQHDQDMEILGDEITEKVKKDPLSHKKRIVKAHHPFDKDELRDQEEFFKIAEGDESKMEEIKQEFVDPDTGEILS